VDNDRIKTFVADQANRHQLQSFIDANGGEFDIIIDDGGHYMKQQQVSFGFLFPFVKPGGLYIIEDLHTSLPKIHPEFKATPATSTLSMIENFIRKNPANIYSSYMTPDEMNYLQDHIDLVSLNTRNRNNRSMTCLFKKK
jgi:hypothetical protein